MGLTSSIQTAFSGLQATQAGMGVVSQNVANSGTVGYTRRVLDTEQAVAGGRTVGVDVLGTSRTLNTLVQRQLRLEQAGASYASTRASAHATLDSLFDQTSGTGSVSTLLNTFTTKLQALSNNPTNYVAQGEALTAASTLATTLNGLSKDVQSLRQDSETALGTAVTKADGLLRQIAGLNGKIGPAGNAALEDQRDALIDQVSTLMDVKVTLTPSGGANLATTGGLQLVEGTNSTRLSFDAHPISAESAYSTDPAKRTVGTITATDMLGATRDVVASGLIRSGEIAAQLEIRDTVLPEAQSQIDQLAAGLAASLSDRTVGGTAASSAGATGYDLDLSALAAGNTLTVAVQDAGGATRNLTFVKVTSAAGAAAATAAGQVPVDLSGGLASAVAQIGTALGSDYDVSNPSGSILRVLNDGATTAVTGLSASVTTTALAGGNAELPLFVDGSGNAAYTGSFERGSQLAGFAGRIVVNPAVVNDRTSLVVYGPSVPSGDITRPNLLVGRLTGASRTFSGAAGIGGSSSAWQGTVSEFAQQIIATQASNAGAASTLDDGQQVVLNAVKAKYSDAAGVNIDTELTELIQLQTAYTANARLISAAKEMMDMLLRIGG